MDRSRGDTWENTTHDWHATVDLDHLATIAEAVETYAPGGTLHLVLEVLAYAADEAESRGGGQAVITLHGDGSVSVADDGRGTDTRTDAHGVLVKKPVMATRDLRFFDAVAPPLLADGQPRRGLSVVAALSARLVHENRRSSGSWRQCYEHGVPVTGLEPFTGDGTTGTTVRFWPVPAIAALSGDALETLARAGGSHLRVELVVDGLPRGPREAP